MRYFRLLVMFLILAISGGGLIGCGSASNNGGDNTPSEFTLTFDANGGAGETPAITGAKWKNVNLRQNAFTAPAGKVFEKWNTKADGSGKFYNANAAYTLTAHQTFYAMWKNNGNPLEFTVNFDANGGTGDEDRTPLIGVSGKKVNLPPNAFIAPDGKVFKSWNTKADGSGTPYNNGAEFTITANQVLYAIWQDRNTPPSEFTISFDLNGGSGEIPTITGLKGTKVNLPQNTLTAPDCQLFGNWNTKRDGSGNKYNPNAEFTIEAEQVIYAVWNYLEYTPDNYETFTPFNTCTATQLIQLAKLMKENKDFSGKTILLKNNIDMKDITGFEGFRGTLGTELFKGTFDGDNKAISNIIIGLPEATNVGLISYLDATGTVKNLSITGKVSGKSEVGGVVGKSEGVISNVKNGANVTATANNVGGVVGIYTYETLSDVSNSGAVTSAGSNVGGVVGNNSSSISNASNSGAISSTDKADTAGNVGGVIGYQQITKQDSNTISNVTNSGNITSTGGNVGGIVGKNSNNVAPFGNISNAGNSGSVESTGEANNISAHVGGIVGENYGHISKASNSGAIKNNTKHYTGGIAGYQWGKNGSLSTISNVSNTGNVTSNGLYVGGIAGEVTYSTTSDVSNTGNIKGGNNIGGIYGLTNSGSAISCAYNIGTISAIAGPSKGGISGARNTILDLKNVYFLKTTSINNDLDADTGEPAVNGSGIDDVNGFKVDVLKGFSPDIWENKTFTEPADIFNGVATRAVLKALENK